jgi:hypothetical protein
VLAGTVPFAFVAYTAAPLVTAIYLEIPSYLRGSEVAFRKFLANPPPDAKLVLTTTRASLINRHAKTSISHLKPATSMLRPVTLVYDGPLSGKFGEIGRKFWVRESSGIKKTDPAGIAGVWEVVLDSIRKNAANVPQVRASHGLKSLRE